MKQLFFLETGPSEPDLKLLRQYVIVGQSFDSLSIVVRNLKFSRHIHGGLNICSRRDWHNVDGFFVHHFEFLLELFVLVLDLLVELRCILIVVCQLDDFDSLLIEVCLQFLEFLVFLLQLSLVSLEISSLLIRKIACQSVEFLAFGSQLIFENFVLVKHNFESLLYSPVFLVVDIRIV